MVQGMKTVIVTGASSGIGRSSAVRFAQEGFNVVICARKESELNKTLEKVEESGSSGLVVPADLSIEKEIEKVLDETVKKFGGLNVLVNAAGIIANGSIENTSVEQWDMMMNINLRSVFLLMQKSIKYLAKTRGSIVNVSSVTGTRAFPGIIAYCVSKAGVDQLTRSAALELAPKGIRVNAVNPGTNLHRNGGMDEKAYNAFLEHSKTTHPLGRVGEPEEVAELILFL